jgi:DNA-binding NarL/FixJ family response regulator
VAVIDISMPEINGIALARRLADDCPGVRVIILTLYEERSFLKQALAAGVKGYVLKRSAAENLARSISTRHSAKTRRTAWRFSPAEWRERGMRLD